MRCHPAATRRRWLRCLAVLAILAAIATTLSAADEPKDPKDVPSIESPKDAAELGAVEAKVRAVVAKVLPCTVGIEIGPSRGSGVIVSEDGLVVTAGHVAVKPGEKAKFVTHDGKTHEGVSLGIFKGADAGLMQITDKGKYPFAELGKSGDLKPGAWCVALGHPLGYQPGRPPVVRVGRILYSEERVVQTDCPLIGGDSGGPLLDLDGKIIGINSRIGGTINMNFHVAIDVFHQHWDRLKKGEMWDDDVPGRDSAVVKAAFRKVVEQAAKCVAQVKCDGKDKVLGTVVGPDGWILTKASELTGKIVCRFRDGRELEAKLVGVDPRFDLAMLKVDAADLPAIPWNLKDPEVGQWVAATGLTDDPLAIGVISVPRRAIPPDSGVLGIKIDNGEQGVTISEVLEKSPAEKAGLKKDDVITYLDGQPAKNRDELAAALRKYRPGTKIKLTVLRDNKKLELEATLGKLITPATQQRDMLNASGVGMSGRRDDFPGRPAARHGVASGGLRQPAGRPGRQGRRHERRPRRTHRDLLRSGQRPDPPDVRPHVRPSAPAGEEAGSQTGARRRTGS